MSYSNADASAFGCDGDVQSLWCQTVTEGECAGNYSILRTVSVENCAGGSADYACTIVVEDTTAPEFDVPADYTVGTQETLC